MHTEHEPTTRRKAFTNMNDARNEIQSRPSKKDFGQLDLDPIKVKLTDTKNGEGWSFEKTEMVAIQYRRFLILIRDNPNATIVPTEDIDRFWHHHILDTMKYAEDCDQYFGYFVHHFPYFGLRGADDAKNLAVAFENTKNLYEERFRENLIPTNGAGCGGVVCEVGVCTAEQRPEYKPGLAAA